MWKQLLDWLSRAPLPADPVPAAGATAPAAPAATAPTQRNKGIAAANAALPFITIEEVDDAAPLAGALFQRKFGHPIPDYPRHFVAFHHAPGQPRSVVGYVHYLAHDDVYLCGGMCVDNLAYRRMNTAEMSALREAGSLAEFLLRQSFDMLGPCAAIFGSVGDATARNVDLRAGFIDTGEPHLMVVWRDAAPENRAALVAKVKALGGF
jgi:hypothetical protein